MIVHTTSCSRVCAVVVVGRKMSNKAARVAAAIREKPGTVKSARPHRRDGDGAHCHGKHYQRHPSARTRIHVRSLSVPSKHRGALPSSAMRPSSDTTALPAVLIGTLVWLTALVVVGIREPLAPPEDGVWWWGVTLVGTASGLIGLPFLVRRRARLAAR